MPHRHVLCLATLMSLLALAPGRAEDLRWFGYTGIDCGLDDPHDATAITDYSDEVAGFTNLSHICLDPDPTVTATRLRNAVAHGFTPLLHVEPAFFDMTPDGLRPSPEAPALWMLVTQAITESTVPASDILFYLVDEPVLRKLPPADLAAAADTLRQTYPEARVMVIDAYDPGGPRPVPPQIDYWGFDAYAVPDPGAEPLYTAYLDRARAGMTPDQHLVLVMDAMHTPVHAEAGITEAGMAEVARAYYALGAEARRYRGDPRLFLGRRDRRPMGKRRPRSAAGRACGT